MAHEAIILELNADTDWDGESITALRRDDAVVTGQRYYQFNISGDHGIVGADLGGLFSPVSAKLIGIASSSWSPQSKARVLTANGKVRQEVTLKPAVQYVMLYPNDRIAFLTEKAPGPIYLSTNEMSEADAIAWGLRHEPFAMPNRLRIVRKTAAPFVLNTVALWQPSFAYNESSGVLSADDDGNGMLPSGSLCLYPRFQSCYVSVRFAGAGEQSRVHLVENITRRTHVIEPALADVKWSKVFRIGHDDGIALEATAAAGVTTLVCDIEVSLVHPGDELRGRFERGL